MIEEPNFYKWLTFSEDAVCNGIRDDAPDDVKKEYEEFLKEEKILEELLIKL